MGLPYMRLFPSDFWGDELVQEMSGPAACAYLALLTVSWQRGPLRDPAGVLERRLRVPPELWEEIRPAWTETPEGWVQGRLEHERGRADERSQSARSSAAMRWQCERNAIASDPQCADDAIQSQNQNQSQKPERETRGRARVPGQSPPRGNTTGTEGGSAPAADAAPRPPAKKPKSTRPTLPQTLKALEAHLGLSGLAGCTQAVEGWYEALRARRKLWASQGALERRLKLLASRPAEALAAIELCRDEAWTDPIYAFRRLDQERAAANGTGFNGRPAPKALPPMDTASRYDSDPALDEFRANLRARLDEAERKRLERYGPHRIPGEGP